MECAGIPALSIKASFRGKTQAAVVDSVCSLDEDCKSQSPTGSANAAFQQGGVCSLSPKQQSKIKAFIFMAFNGLQHNKSCSTKRS